MNIHEFYNTVSKAVRDRTLQLSSDLADGEFSSLLFVLYVTEVNDCTVSLIGDNVQIDGRILVEQWNSNNPFNIRILCSEQKVSNNQSHGLIQAQSHNLIQTQRGNKGREQGSEQSNIIMDVALWTDFSGTLQEFLGNIYQMPLVDSQGMISLVDAIGDIRISNPVINFVTADKSKLYPLRFSAKTQIPKQAPWTNYSYVLSGVSLIEGWLNRVGEFDLAIPLTSKITGLFDFVNMSLLLKNGSRNDFDMWHSKQSVAGLRVRLQMKELNTVDFTIPLFINEQDWSLTAQFSEGLGITDVANLMFSLFGIGGNHQQLCLPADTALNQFKLYRIGMLASKSDLDLSLRYLEIDFALAKPWQLPVPYVVLNSLYIQFLISKGDGVHTQDILTAHAGGEVLVTLGSYKLSLDLDMELPSREFTAKLELSKNSQQHDIPNLQDLSKGMGIILPDNWGSKYNQLGRITIWGAMEARSFSIQGEVYDLLTFNIGDLSFNLDSLMVEADVETSHFAFGISGLMTFGEGENSFSIYLAAKYKKPSWEFSGGLSQGKVDIGQLLTLMFKIPNPAQDICALKISELDVRYETINNIFTLTAAFEAKWHIKLLGKDFILGGRIQVWQQKETNFDVSALAYINLGDFLVLAQVDHVQNAESTATKVSNVLAEDTKNVADSVIIVSTNDVEGRSYLFRLQYGEAYLQAAWFKRKRTSTDNKDSNEYDEILAVSLGGMSLGKLMEALVNMINPKKRYHLPAPWNVLNKIELSKFILELNVTQNQATFIYKADLNIAGILYLENLGVLYDMNQRRLYFVLTGSLLGIHYDAEDPIKWDAINEQPPANSAENEQIFRLHYLGLGQHLKVDGITQVESIAEAINILSDQVSPEKLEQGVSFDAGSNWVFGADFTINNMVRLNLVLNDPYLYGLLVTVQGKKGSVLESFDGLGIELMCKKVNETVYMFRGELIVPTKYRTFQLGAISLTLGTIRVDIYTNGGFCVDLGFPYNLDFSRSFVVEWGIFTGRGGVYLGVTKDVAAPHLPAITNGNFSPIISLGIGLSVGIGRSFDLGIVKGGMSAEVFGLFEGVLAVFHPSQGDKESLFYYVQAEAGVIGQLYLSVDFKVITIQATAQIKASAMLTIQAYRSTAIELELSLKLGAKIKILFIKISFSFKFHQTVKFTFGQDSQTPWIKEDSKNNSIQLRQLRKISLGVGVLDKRNMQLSVVPMLYRANPSLDKVTTKHFGAAFLIMMDQHAQEQWTRLLAEWVLLHIGDTNKSIFVQDMRNLTPDVADSLTYQVLEDFLKQNTQISYDVHWVQSEQCLRDKQAGEMEGFVFPMLPGIELSFGVQGQEVKISYDDRLMVDSSYFDALTEYFKQLNPAKDEIEPIQQSLSDEIISISKAFFLDYFQMFLREVIERLTQPFADLTTDGNTGVITSAELYGLPVAEILRQNTGLQFEQNQQLNLPVLQWLIIQSDSLQLIAERFNLNQDDQEHDSTDKQIALWNSLKDETFLLDNAATLQLGKGQLNNATNLSLKQASAFIFVRFYEELIPDQLFYVSDLINLNPNFDINWQETQVYQSDVNSCAILQLPNDMGTYIAMRGDTLERIAKYIYILQLQENSLPEWWSFYADMCKLNSEPLEGTLETICYNVPYLTLVRDLSLADLAMRIYPDKMDEDIPSTKLWGATVLRCNVPVQVPNVVYKVGSAESANLVTISDVIQDLSCTVEELAPAIKSDQVFKLTNLNLKGIAKIEKAELVDLVAKSSDEIGSMLSRLLLQGLTIPEPNTQTASAQQEDVVKQDGSLSKLNSNEIKLKPLFDVLGQMLPLEQTGVDYTLQVATNNNYETWIQSGSQSVLMHWDDIADRLPSGDLTDYAQPWQVMDTFTKMPQCFTLTDGAVCHWTNGQGYLYALSETVQRLIRQKVSDTENEQGADRYCSLPELVDEQGVVQAMAWSCILPVSIAKCSVNGMFTVYGIDAEKRRVLHSLLADENEISVHFLYRASALSKGKQDFWEYDWDQSSSFLVKTNLSRETHMGGLRRAQRDAYEHIADLSNPHQMLRMLWECSTVCGGGYYLQLKTAGGQTLPEDIFDSDGMADIWVLVQCTTETVLPCESINSCVLKSVPNEGTVLSLVTTDPAQQFEQAVFPVGCIGLSSHQKAPQEGSVETNEEYLHSLFQITGYKVLGHGEYIESNCSAPVMPEEEGDEWNYHTVIPVYRYVNGGNQDNPYLAVGKTVDISLEQRDVLGNTLQIGTTSTTPLYNDVLIGIGQYPATKATYAIVKQDGRPTFRLTFNSEIPESPSSELVAFQRKAAMQLIFDDIEVELSTSLNEQKFSLRNLKLDDGSSYLERLIAYVNDLANALEGKGNIPVNLILNFDLDVEQYPLPKTIFKLEAILTISRHDDLVSDKAPSSKTASSVIFPFYSSEQENTAQVEQSYDQQNYNEQNLIEFCNASREALPNLYFAQTADADGVLYGITYGESGLIKRLAVFPLDYSLTIDGKTTVSTSGGEKTVLAPEFYALKPLHNGLISRTALVRILDENNVWLEDKDQKPVEFSDVDIELWAKQFLQDVEALLEPENLQKANVASTGTLNQLISIKDKLAHAIATQIMSLRQLGPEVTNELRNKMIDRLRRSLTVGYSTDVLALYGLIFETSDSALYRLECTAHHEMVGCQIEVGKAESQQSIKENHGQRMTICFSNDFQMKSQELNADLLFTEVEYDIAQDKNGYESSRWLRFIEPLRAEHAGEGQFRDLVSDILLPNPLRECPQLPVLEGHKCDIHLGSDRGERILRLLSQDTRNTLRWDYQASMKYSYNMQDRFEIRIEFKPMQALRSGMREQDLFDHLAEYYLYGSQLINLMAEQSGDSEVYKNAFVAFVDLADKVAVCWPDWEYKASSRAKEYKNLADNTSIYSCIVEGNMSEQGLEFKVTSTDEGNAFLQAMGLEGQEPVVGSTADGDEYLIQFTMKNLPLFDCASAEPFVKVVRNQNLLNGSDFALDVREEFIYRTQEVSLNQLLVSGEYNESYVVDVIKTTEFSESVFEQAVQSIYQALGLEQYDLDLEITVSYEYSLAAGQGLPHIELPVTFMPAINTQSVSGAWIVPLATTISDWYDDMQPLQSDCGLRFDVKIYQAGKKERLLHFTDLKVKFEIGTKS